jgi:hypothetical protein
MEAMNVPLRRKPQPKYRLVKAADSSPKATRRVKKGMNRLSKKVEKSGRREELLKELPRSLRD